MAYFTQEMKKAIAPKVKAVCAKYGVKASLSVRNHSVVVLTVKSGKIDFFGKGVANEHTKQYITNNYVQVNHYHIDSHYTGKAAAFLNEVKKVLNTGNFDNSDVQTDYFHVGFYVNINIGNWNTPYVFEA